MNHIIIHKAKFWSSIHFWKRTPGKYMLARKLRKELKEKGYPTNLYEVQKLIGF